MIRTIYHVTGSPDGSESKGGKAVTIVHLKLGKITKRSDGRYQAAYRDLDGNRKFITCNTEDEVLERFQALELAYNAQVEHECLRYHREYDSHLLLCLIPWLVI